jgi:hypothetical protein
MIRSDYLLRLAEQMASFLAQVLWGRTVPDPAEQARAFQAASLQYLGLGYEIIEALPEEELLRLLSGRQGLDIEKCFLAAELLRTHAQFLEENRQLAAAATRYARSLRLFLEAFPHLPGLAREPAVAKIREAIERTRGAGLPAATVALLVNFHRETGDLAKAEDALFALLEADAELAKTAGEAFYQSLLALSDEQLAQGGLPRDEVEEGQAAFRRKSK